MAPSTPGSRRESPQKWKEWSTTSIILQKGAFLIPSPLAGGLSELPDRKHAASIHAQKWSERSSAISNVGVATICLVFFNLQPRALLRLKKINKKTGGKQKMNLAKNSFPFWIFCHINLRPLRVNADLGERRTHLADNFVLFATSLCLGTIYGQAMTISNSSIITMAISLYRLL